MAVMYATGDDDDVTLFTSKAQTDTIPGLPKLDPRRVVRVSSSL